MPHPLDTGCPQKSVPKVFWPQLQAPLIVPEILYFGIFEVGRIVGYFNYETQSPIKKNSLKNFMSTISSVIFLNFWNLTFQLQTKFSNKISVSITWWMNLERNLYLVKTLVPESLKLKAKELNWFSLSLLCLLCLLSIVSYFTQEQKYEL